jgi:hypothetical protein
MRNSLVDLNIYLFEQLERLNDEESDLDEEIIRARAIADIAKNIVENANTILKAKKFQYESLGKENITIPKLIEGE